MFSVLRCTLILLLFTSVFAEDEVPNPNGTSVDIHTAKEFNLTDWIEKYPNEKDELNEWKTHLLEHASTSMTALKDNVLNTLFIRGVVEYFKTKETPIHMKEIEWKPVNIDSMTINAGKFRPGFLENYRDPEFKSFYEGFAAFYADMESTEVTFEGENKTETYYLWGRNYNKTPMYSEDWSFEDKEVTFEITKIFVKKWESVKDVLKAPGDIMLKKYTYKLNAQDIFCWWNYCYFGYVKNVLDASVSHFVNTGKTKQESWIWE